MEMQEHVPLASFTTFGIGGPARWFVEAATEAQAVEAVEWARAQRVPLFVLGGGSNLLVSDSGFPGLVLRIAFKGIATREDGNARIFSAAAGEDWDALVQFTVDQNCAGIECLAGIPGTAGGTPVQNVGAYGQEVAETILSVRVLDLETLTFVEMPAAACKFAYRTSLFNTSARGRFLVTKVDYRLIPGGPPRITYADLQRRFPPGSSPSLAAVAAAVREIRHAKGMLLIAGDQDCRSAGSFFKNPVVSAEQFARLAARLAAQPPSYPAGENHRKLPAAWLVEHAGFPKSYQLGRAGISSRHTLALVNLGDASAQDILALRDQIVAGVAERFGISLEMEPVLLGFAVT